MAKMSERVQAASSKPENIRNMAIAAHIDWL